MNLVDKISQLHRAKTKFYQLGDVKEFLKENANSPDASLHAGWFADPHDKQRKILSEEYDMIEHYRKMFRNSDELDKLSDLNQQLRDTYKKYRKQIQNTKRMIIKALHSHEVNIMQRDHVRYKTEVVTQELLDQRKDNVSPEFVELVQSVIQRNTDWRFAGCVLNPVDDQYVKAMIACEPLYIVTNNDVSIGRIKSNLSEFFVNQRLRLYNSLEGLPQHLGLTICVNQFEYIPLDEQSDILKQTYEHTMPGGLMLLTYNDCDQRTSLEHTLEGLRFYCTRDLLVGKAWSIGWNVVKSETTNNGMWTYVVLQKPGELYSMKTSAPLVENIRFGLRR